MLGVLRGSTLSTNSVAKHKGDRKIYVGQSCFVTENLVTVLSSEAYKWVENGFPVPVSTGDKRLQNIKTWVRDQVEKCCEKIELKFLLHIQ